LPLTRPTSTTSTNSLCLFIVACLYYDFDCFLLPQVSSAGYSYARTLDGVAIGELTAVAADAAYLYYFHRGPTDFSNAKPLMFDPIVRYDRRRQMAAGSLGKGLFTVLDYHPPPPVFQQHNTY